MRLVVQRINRAKLTVDDKLISEVGMGFLVLVGISPTDTPELVKFYAKKVSKLRIFRDENGKTNLYISEVNGEILAVSNFTLYGDTKAANRPSFSHAAPGDFARPLYDLFCEELNNYVPTKKGVFGEHMHIDMDADGPVTFIIDSDN